MKKTFFFLFLLFLGLQVKAQEMTQLQQKAMNLIEMTSGQQFEVMLDPVLQMVPEENRKAFKKEVEASLKNLYLQIAQVYTEEFTEAEIDKILAFYNTPVGKKMRDFTPEVTKKAMEIGQQWGQELQPIMMKYMLN